MSGLTDRQREVLEFIRVYTEGNGYAPSIRDMSVRFGMSLNGVRAHLIALEKKGAILRTEGKARSIVICAVPGKARPAQPLPADVGVYDVRGRLRKWCRRLTDEDLSLDPRSLFARFRPDNQDMKRTPSVDDIKKAIQIERRRRRAKKNGSKRSAADRLRTRVSHAIRSPTDGSANVQALIGCSASELRRHIESLFDADMSWDNYGRWHIDHIVPCSAFDLDNDDERKQCFHWSNLQPLWASDNYAKGASIDRSHPVANRE